MKKKIFLFLIIGLIIVGPFFPVIHSQGYEIGIDEGDELVLEITDWCVPEYDEVFEDGIYKDISDVFGSWFSPCRLDSNAGMGYKLRIVIDNILTDTYSWTVKCEYYGWDIDDSNISGKYPLSPEDYDLNISMDPSDIKFNYDFYEKRQWGSGPDLEFIPTTVSDYLNGIDFTASNLTSVVTGNTLKLSAEASKFACLNQDIDLYVEYSSTGTIEKFTIYDSENEILYEVSESSVFTGIDPIGMMLFIAVGIVGIICIVIMIKSRRKKSIEF